MTNWTTIKKFTYTTEVDTDTLPTGRTYHTPDGSYPSITTILGKTSDQTWLLKWKERVGEEEAARVSKEATDRGTLVHEYAENYFNGEDIWDRLREEKLDVRQMSRDLIRATEQGVEEVVKKVILPLWNTYSFFVTYANIDGFDSNTEALGMRSNPLDKWILSETQKLTLEIRE